LNRKPLTTAILCGLAASIGAQTTQADDQLEEVIVTATKRAQSTQDIAVSIQALSGKSIKALGVDNFNEYVQYLPNVTFAGRGPGQAELYIRGASTEQSAITLSSVQSTAPSVALYLDEQPVSFAGRNLDVYAADLERIEVLPGPQGTLFGASSQSGTVRLITNKPQHDGFGAGFDMKYAFTKGGEPSAAVEGYANIVFTDKLAIRLTAYTDRAGGWVDNVPGTYAGDIEVMNRNQISSAAHICTGDPAVDDPIGGNCNGVRATMAVADNSSLVEKDFNQATYSGGRLGLSYLINDGWDVLLQHTSQTLDTEGVFEYDPNLEGTESVNRFTPTRNEDEFGLTTWTLRGRINALEMLYTGGYLDREVFYQQDYTGYTNGGGYQAYYLCQGGYSNYTECFDPTKQYLGNTSNERMTHEFRINTDDTKRWRITAGVYYDEQKTMSDGQFQYFGAVEAGFNQASAPGTITDPPNSPPTDSNIVSTVPGVTDPYGRGPSTTFVNSFTRKENQLALFGELEFDLTETLTASVGARYYNLDYRFTGSTGSSFGCKYSPTPCDGQAFDNRVTYRLRALGAYNESGDINDLLEFFSESNAQIIVDGIDAGTFTLEGLGADGVINQDDVIYRGTLKWNITEDVMLFGAYSEGYRPQTSNRNAGQPSANQTGVYKDFIVPAVTKSDELINYEIGVKGDFFDHQLRVNATAYKSNIDNLQMSRFDPANVAFLVFLENVGDAEVKGLDADFSWLATENLVINGALSLVDNEFTRVNPQLNEIVVPVGSRLPWTPELSGNLRATYHFPLDAMQAEGFVRAAVTYTGDSRALSTCNAYAIEDVAAQVYGNGTGLKIVEEGGFCGTPLAGDDLASVVDKSTVAVDGNGDTRFKAARYEQKAYTLFNAAFGIRKDQWTAELFVDNLFDKHAQLNINAADYTPSVTTNRPRTIGVRFSYDY
jgi:iron complex outermembrane receptor protein